MPAIKQYTRKNWESYPSTNTPVSAENLNIMDKGIDDLDNTLVELKNTVPKVSRIIDPTSPIPRDADTLGGVWTGEMLTENLTNIDVYVGEEDGKLHFVDSTGADSVLPFNKSPYKEAWIRMNDKGVIAVQVAMNDKGNIVLSTEYIYYYNRKILTKKDGYYRMQVTDLDQTQITVDGEWTYYTAGSTILADVNTYPYAYIVITAKDTL